MRDTSKSPQWVEKYRPRKIEDCVLPKAIKATFLQIVQDGVIPNMILHGSSGTGKTTAAMALGDELGLEWIIINGSEDRNIDTLRGEVRDFCSTRSFSGKPKLVIFDESDNLNPTSTQPALRNFLEEFSANSFFIFTANIFSKLIPALHSRLPVIEYVITKAEKESICKQFLKRIKFILDAEGVGYDPKVLIHLILKFFPDFRRCIGELQKYAKSGAIDEGVLVQVRDAPLAELIAALKVNDFKVMRAWCAMNANGDVHRILRQVYDHLYNFLQPEVIPEVVVLIGLYQYRAAFVADFEIHLTAFFTELMMCAKYKE